MMDNKSHLQRVLEAGHFAVSAEIGPPMSANGEFVRKKARALKGFVDAANVTDNQTAMVRDVQYSSFIFIITGRR